MNTRARPKATSLFYLFLRENQMHFCLNGTTNPFLSFRYAIFYLPKRRKH